jgi:hypothetical protein
VKSAAEEHSNVDADWQQQRVLQLMQLMLLRSV